MKNYYINSSNGDVLGGSVAIPRLLVTHSAYRFLSSEAKIMYALFLDKMSDCMANNWYDEEHHVYILYPEYEIQKDMNISEENLKDSLEELNTIGLIERKKQDLELPTRIYVKNVSGISNVDAISIGRQSPSMAEFKNKLQEFELEMEEMMQHQIIEFPEPFPKSGG